MVIVPPQTVWKLVLALALIAVILVSQVSRAPRRAVPGGELRRLVIAAVTLYVVGALASLTHHPLLAAIVYASGIVTCTLAAWLSRGRDSEDPPEEPDPADQHPPPPDDGLPEFDWTAFEAALRAETERRPPAQV